MLERRDPGREVRTPCRRCDVAPSSTDKQRRIDGFFDNSIVGMVQSTLDGHLLAVNSTLAKWLEFDSPADMLHLKDVPNQLYLSADRRKQMIDELVRFGAVREFPVILRTRFGAGLPVRLTAWLVGEPESEDVYIEGIVLSGSVSEALADEEADEQLNLAHLAIESVREGICIT